MGLITETSLRTEIRNKSIDKYFIKPGTKITPSARQYLKDRNIELVVEEKNTEDASMQDRSGKDEEKPSARYTFADTSCYLDKKPEYMTQLYGKRLVYKDHPRIVFRGAIDSLQSRILLLQAEAADNKQDKLVKELEEILLFVRNIMRCEVLEEEFPAVSLLGMENEELREKSHNPVKYFNMKHILPNYGMGRIALELNALRSGVREAEIAAVKAFRKEEAVEREDLITALNRLSSCVYIMMLKYLNGAYR
ncbi:MAG: cobalamin adenosyltransferase [Clostridiaceae bacterium]|nr:cobalamin adenosyltransferase [Clostridiaceae bacterium]